MSCNNEEHKSILVEGDKTYCSDCYIRGFDDGVKAVESGQHQELNDWLKQANHVINRLDEEEK